MRRNARTTHPFASPSAAPLHRRPCRRSTLHGFGPLTAATCLVLLMTGTGAQAAGQTAQGAPATPSTAKPSEPQSRTQEMDRSGNYRQEVQACREGRTGEDRATCLKEARFAEAERRRGTLTNTGSFQDNALARCQIFKTADDKEACRARIVGHVQIEGSVAGGGILRQIAITQPAPLPVDNESAMGAGPAPAQPGMAPSSPAPSDDLAPEGGEPPKALPEVGPTMDPREMLDEWQ